jgi:hypothetical protein
MSIEALSLEEIEAVRRAISAMPALLTFEFEARMGITEESASFLLENWPNINDVDDDSDACLAVNNSLNDLLHGIGITDERSRELTGVNREELRRIYRKWATARGWKYTGVR